MQSTDELQALVAKIQAFRESVPEAQRRARYQVWLTRGTMFFAMTIVAFNFVMVDLPLLVVLAIFLSAGTLLHATHQLIKAEMWRMELKAMDDTSATDLEKAMALLEGARTTTEERPRQ